MAASPATLTSSHGRSLVPASPAGRFGLTASLAVAAYVALPARPAAEILAVLIVAGSALAVVTGVAVHRPDRRSGWWFVAAAIAVHALAAAVHGWELASGDGAGRGEAIALLAYPPMLIGLWGVSARRLPEGFGDRRWVIAASAVCAVVWLAVVHPTLVDGSLPFRATDRVGVHALLDGVAAAVVGRRLIASGERNGSLLLATGALVLWGDAHGIVGSQGYRGATSGSSLAAGSLLIGPVLLGMAALVPDMATTEPADPDDTHWYRRSVQELVVAAGITVGVAATMITAATGTASTLPAAALLIAAIVAIGAGAIDRRTADPTDAPVEPSPPVPDLTRQPGPVAASRPGPAAENVLRTDQLELVHLPYVDLATGEVLGVEALVRWRHPTRGLLAPAEFLGMNDRPTLTRAVDEWTVPKAIADAASWRTPALIGINIGPERLAERALVDHVLETADALGVATDRIVLETTERAFLDERAPAFAHARRLRDAGVHVAIDDFGRSVGSLRSLVNAPVDVVKIRAGALRRSSGDLDLAAIRAARSTGHRTAIVGLDDPALVRLARDAGVEIGQGFALSRPLSPEVVARRFDPAG